MANRKHESWRAAPFWIIVNLTILTIGSLAGHSAFGQTSDDPDPLSRLRDVTRNSELILLWSEESESGTSTANQRIYDLDLVQSEPSQRLVGGSVRNAATISGQRRMAVATGSFTGSGYEHFVSAWTGPDNAITVSVPDINPETLDLTGESVFTVDRPLAAAGRATLRLAAGDLAGDMRDEFVLGFQGDDDTIHLQVYGFSGSSLAPELLGDINDEAVAAEFPVWDIVTGDFNANGDDDLALLFLKPSDPTGWSAAAKIYSFEENGSLISGPTIEFFEEPAYPYSEIGFAAAAGHVDADQVMELAVAFTFAQNESTDDTYLYVLDVDSDLNVITTADSMRVARGAQNESEITPINLASGDLDGDARDELVVATAGGWTAYKVNDNHRPEPWKTGGGTQPHAFGDSDSFLTLDDMDANGRSEIIVGGSFVQEEPGGVQYLTIAAYSLQEIDDQNELVVRLIGTREFEMPISRDLDRRRFAVAAGDFDADRMRLGTPTYYRRSGVLQPSVVLNTPPVHFDILGGTPYDLSGCFPDQGCGFSSSYTQTSSSALTVTIEHHEDWGVSASSSASAGILELKATGTYGEKFSRTATSKETTVISTGRVAAGDDWIYATLLDIDYYEYPVYEGDDPTPVGYYIVSIPNVSQPLWIESKNDALLGNMFRPDHEVGNLLSYRRDDAVDFARGIVDFDQQTIGSSGSSSAQLELQRFTETGAETSWESGFELSSKLSGKPEFFGVEVGIELEVKGEYGRGVVNTQTVTVEESLEMRADFGRLQTGFGTSGTYQIEPYAYWTIYGALAIDYKVTFPTGSGSFWQEHYGNRPDVGFSLPWRYDVQKGLPLPGGDPTYAQRSRDIILSKRDPEGGDTVLVGARVRNMGLADIEVPVTLDFYLGDPDVAGSPFASLSTDATIGAQGSEDVFVEWIIPEEVSLRDERIYVVLDGAGQIANDVHSNNNVAWTPAVSYSAATSRDEYARDSELPDAVVLHPAYPNPFQHVTTITVALPVASHIEIKVYDIVGREVTVLADEAVGAGVKPYFFEATGLASGIYFYEVIARPLGERTQSLREMKKLVLVR